MIKYFILLLAFLSFGLIQTDKLNFSLTPKDRNNYTLSIDQRKVGKIHDTVVRRERCRAFLVPVKLSNNSDDTLRYMSWTCGTHIIYTISNKNLSEKGWGCDMNIPDVIKLPPHRSSIVFFKLFLADNKQHINTFKIGMYLYKCGNKIQFSPFDDECMGRRKRSDCLIWSNEVSAIKI